MQAPFDIAADLHTPVSAFLRLAGLGPRHLLESVERGGQARYSFIGFGRTSRIRVSEAGVTADGDLVSSDLLDGLRSAAGGAPRTGPAILGQPFNGGLVGVAAFDMVRHLYRLPASPHSSSTPLGAYMATESQLVFDHFTRRIALLHSGSDADRAALRAQVVAALSGPVEVPAAAGGRRPSTPSLGKGEFMDGVRRVKRHIAAGDVYQLVLSIRFSGQTDLNPFSVYRALRLLNPSPYMYFLDLGDLQVVGSSPEALVKLRGEIAELRPIAGTRRRGVDDDQDRLLERQLLADPKEAAEHVMLVDL
ncbi:MAG: chorismate-binding protein, partial [Actinomycetota bacterium]|nr:chorismate-binding protein [Actinomycetota bacterium]